MLKIKNGHTHVYEEYNGNVLKKFSKRVWIRVYSFPLLPLKRA